MDASDPAREPLSKFQRLSLALNAIGLVISALGFTAVIVSICTFRECLIIRHKRALLGVNVLARFLSRVSSVRAAPSGSGTLSNYPRTQSSFSKRSSVTATQPFAITFG